MKDTSEVIKLPGQLCSNYSDSSDLAIDIDITSEVSTTATYSSHARIESHYSKTRPGGAFALVSSGIGIDVDAVDVDGELKQLKMKWKVLKSQRGAQGV
jgi:hypothetical protein